MPWLVLFMLLILSAALLLSVLSLCRRHGAAGALALVGILLLLIGAVASGWEHLVTATAVVALLVLGVMVMFQRIPPSRALAGALGGFLLLFPCVWLALRLGELFLLGEQPRWLPEAVRFSTNIQFPTTKDVYWPALLCAAGLAGLAAACFLDRQAKVLVVFLCVFVLAYFAPQWLEHLRFLN